MPEEHGLRLSLLLRRAAPAALARRGRSRTSSAGRCRRSRLLSRRSPSCSRAWRPGCSSSSRSAARILGEPPRRRDVVATIAIVVGIAVLAVAAPAPIVFEHAHGAPLALALTALALLALAPYLLDRLGRGHATVTVAGAGVGYATGGVTTALAADALHRGAWLEALAWALATGLASGSGLLSEMSALQDAPAIHVAPVVFTIQTVVPVALAPWLLHATLTDPGQLPAVAAGLALVVAGSWALSRSSALLGLTGEPASAA